MQLIINRKLSARLHKCSVSCRFIMTKSLKEIQRMPTCLEKIHESCFRSYHILDQVLNMVERGDSKETIFEVVEFLREYPVETELVSRPSNGS